MKPCIKVAHKLSIADSFMFLPLELRKIPLGEQRFSFYRGGLQELNDRAQQGEFDVVVVSSAAYPRIADRYQLLNVGTYCANDEGPVVITTNDSQIKGAEDLRGKTIAFAGKDTSSFIAAQEVLPNFEAVHMGYWEIAEAVLAKEVHAAVFFHPNLRYRNFPLKQVLSLGSVWQKKHQLPLPLRSLAISKNIDSDTAKEIATKIRASITYALSDPDETLRISLARKQIVAQGYGENITIEQARENLASYISASTLSLDDKTKEGIAAIVKASTTDGNPIDISYIG